MMLEIREISGADKSTIDAIVEIHMNTFTGFFLTFMGRGFLQQMYSSYCIHAPSGLLAAVDENEKPVGFLAYSGDLSGLYKFMLKKRLIPFAWYAFGAFLRKPKAFFRIVRAFLKPGESKRQEAYVELASIGVSPEQKGSGIGTALVAALKARVDFSQYAYITLETDAVDNEPANQFYQRNGFVLKRSFTTPEGRKMNEYCFEGN